MEWHLNLQRKWPGVYGIMEQEHIPYMLVDRYIDKIKGGIVCVDHVEGGYLATRYLLDRGHRHIACITGPSNLIDSRQRLEDIRERCWSMEYLTTKCSDRRKIHFRER